MSLGLFGVCNRNCCCPCFVVGCHVSCLVCCCMSASWFLLQQQYSFRPDLCSGIRCCGRASPAQLGTGLFTVLPLNEHVLASELLYALLRLCVTIYLCTRLHRGFLELCEHVLCQQSRPPGMTGNVCCCCWVSGWLCFQQNHWLLFVS